MDLARVIEHPLGSGGLSRINVGDDPYVSESGYGHGGLAALRFPRYVQISGLRFQENLNHESISTNNMNVVQEKKAKL